ESTKAETHFDDENLVYSVLDLFGAGTGTTSTTLRWGILLMMKYPEIQKEGGVTGWPHPPLCKKCQKNRSVTWQKTPTEAYRADGAEKKPEEDAGREERWKKKMEKKKMEEEEEEHRRKTRRKKMEEE
ncbi:hypothetical protein AB205_0203250, partial [Aquarana catesbeiana]